MGDINHNNMGGLWLFYQHYGMFFSRIKIGISSGTGWDDQQSHHGLTPLGILEDELPSSKRLHNYGKSPKKNLFQIPKLKFQVQIHAQTEAQATVPTLW